jgi:predicted acetyltransferase
VQCIYIPRKYENTIKEGYSMKVELRELSVNDGKDIYEMIKEMGLGENGFTNSFPTSSYGEFAASLSRFVEIAREINLPEHFVPQTIYWLIIDDKPVGFGKIRHHLNQKLLEHGGHVGYIVRPSERGKGYGKLFLNELIKSAKSKGIYKMLITCDVDNKRSRRVIESNNGQLKEMKDNVCKYWIELIN